jgi:hypothetical protein
VLRFYIKSLNPRGHIEACSFISYYLAEIIDSEIYNKDSHFYGMFHVSGTEYLFEALSQFSSNIIIELPPERTIRN